MVWGAIVGGLVGALGSYASSRSASSSAERAAETSAEAQMAGLDYLKESERLPMYYRDQALRMLAGEYGLQPYQSPVPVGEDGRQIIGYTEDQVVNPDYRNLRSHVRGIPQYITEDSPIYGEVTPGEQASTPSVAELATSSPLYQAMLSSRGSGEEAIMRSAAATGGLRGGATIGDLADYNTQLENQALLTSYQNIMGGLSSMAGAQGYAPQIAQQYSNIGAIRGAGITGAARARQEGYAGISQGIGQGLSAYFNQPQSGYGGGGNMGAPINQFDYSGYV